jgi:DNA-binding CsgD family transcriptional regulator
MKVLLEREREVAELGAALDRANAGKGSAVAIEAKAGLGKTRLLREVCEVGGSAGLNVLSARATDLEREFPFALVRQLFESELVAPTRAEREALLEGAGAARRALGLDTDDDRAHDSFAVLHGLYWVTAALAEQGPLLLTVDDAHTADEASLDYLGFLLPRLEELPVLLVLTSRPDEPDPPAGLGRVLIDASVRHLALAPISVEATTALLAEELGQQPEREFAATCHEVSGGNPFLLCELARTLLEERIEPAAGQVQVVRKLAPERVARMVLTRIARLPSEAESLARSLAVLGDGSELRLVAELAGVDPRTAQRAADELRASAIFGGDTSLRFIHPLVRNAIYAAVPASERAALHGRAATLLREDRVPPEQIATQLLVSEAQGKRATVEILLDAGERALATGAPRSAIAYLTRALREPPPAEMRAMVLGPLITAGFRAADHSVLSGIEADIDAEFERDPSLRTRWAADLMRSMALGGRFEEAATMLTEAVEIAATEGDVQRAFQLEAQLSTLALVVPSVPAVNVAGYADQIDPDSPSGRLAAAMEVRAAAVGGTAHDAADAAKRALGDNGVIFAEEPELVASTVAVMALVAADEVDAARHGAERALAIAHERGATPDISRGWFLRGFVAWGEGDLIAAEADVRQAIDLARLAGIVPAVLMYTGPLMEILIERDELGAAEAELQATGMARGPIPANAMFSIVLLIRGHLRFEQGELEDALEDLLALSGREDQLGLGPGPLATASPLTVRALTARGDQARAQEIADRAMAPVRRWGAPASIAHVLRADAAARGGADGIRSLQEAAALMEDSPRRLERAHVLLELGTALRVEGRRGDARAVLLEAFKLARQCGAARIAKRAHGELGASGETIRRYLPIGVESLTPSERRVAELAASGMTNRQIAQSLFVTVKTVEAHLSATYDKLDISSRRQLGDALAEPVDP